MNKNILSIDAETNSLWSKAFAIAATLHNQEGKEIKNFIGRCPIKEEVNTWVEENVIPQIQAIEITHDSYEELLEGFISFYLENKSDADIIVHMGLPVEARLFIDAHNLSFLGDWDAPYPLIDISAIKQINTSVDGYNSTHGIIIDDCCGGTHNPLYDCRAATMAYLHYNKTN